MSLLTSVTAESQSVPSFIPAAYTAGGAAMVATAAPEGIVRVQPGSSGGGLNVTRLRGAAPATTLSLGLDGATVGANANAIVVTSGPDLTTIATNAVCSQALTVNGAATFNGSVNMSTTAPTLQTITVAGVVAADTVPVALPQPVGLDAGLYSVGLSIPANRDRQIAALAYWDGAAWTIGGAISSISTLGPGNSAMHPAAGGASLTYVQSSGGPLTITFVYYTQLAAQF